MIRGVLRKILLETWTQTLLFGLALLLVGTLLTVLLPHLEQGLDRVLATFPFVQKFIQALLGQELDAAISAQSLQSIIWVHPTVLTLLWAQEIIFCTRVPAGEIDRGTIDVLLSWPVSRRRLFCIESACWLTTGIWLTLMLLLGHAIGRMVQPSDLPHSWRSVRVIALNLYSVYVTVGATALLISTCSDRRGRAMAGVFGLVLASFLFNFLVQFWTPATVFAPLGVLNYYRPAHILASGQVPLRDITVLWGTGIIAWLVALEVFARRSISTV